MKKLVVFWVFGNNLWKGLGLDKSRFLLKRGDDKFPDFNRYPSRNFVPIEHFPDFLQNFLGRKILDFVRQQQFKKDCGNGYE